MEKLSEEQSVDRDAQTDTRISASSQVGPANQDEEAGEETSTKRSNQPPRKKKNEALVLKHYRLRAIDIRQTEAVIIQRGSDMGDTVRKQYERGVHVDTALGAAGPDGLYGLYQGQRLAELLRADLDGLISFALNHGVVPMMLAEYRRIIAELNETIQSLPRKAGTFPHVPKATSLSNGQMQLPDASQIAAVTQVADEADGVLDMFFGGTENFDEVIETDSNH